MNLGNSYADRTEKVGKVLRKILKKSTGGFSEENIHDIRTSIRRLQSVFKVLPKTLQKRKRFRQHLDACGDLFKALTEARDCDVILSRLSQYPENQALKEAKSFVGKKRNNLMKRARKRALSLMNLRDPQIREFPESKLNKLYETRLKRQAKKVRLDLAIVWTGKAKKNEIHELRKDCKKLRYTLELDAKKHVKQLQVLKEWQKYLGTIHDIEMTQEILRKKNDGSVLDSTIRAEEIDNVKNYDTFMSKSRAEEARSGISFLFGDGPQGIRAVAENRGEEQIDKK